MATPKYDIIIGVDPDNRKSGVATLDVISRKICVSALQFSEAVNYITQIANDAKMLNKRLKVYIEGGWLNKSNWHVLGKYMSTAKAAAIGRSAGMNHQTGILLAEMLQSNTVDYDIVKPLKKCWRGTDGKITQPEIELFMGELPRMNQDCRDAALLAWVMAGLPIRTVIQFRGRGI